MVFLPAGKLGANGKLVLQEVYFPFLKIKFPFIAIPFYFKKDIMIPIHQREQS